MTDFSEVYNSFLSKITDDMYMELTEEETKSMLKELLLGAIPFFEFPRVDIFDYDLDGNMFAADLNHEEVNILAIYMVVEWLGEQLASIENTRMKYSGTDFKFTSQANHLSKVTTLKKEYERLGFHMQRLYKRRIKNDKGIMRSTFGSIMEKGRFNAYGY